jgi:hypothetical protein
MNIGGAKDRPRLDEVWADVEAGLSGQAMHKKYSTTTFFGMLYEMVFG